jgi:hypothetical protein
MDTHDQTFGQKVSILIFFKFLVPLDNLLFENKGQECQLENVNIWDHTHGCLFMCNFVFGNRRPR